ncbi:MAG: hypothetical protein QG653_273 [Patescibacteria group bacterium]|nr:hypothetical protein [Patescibacteria group bacterium]
MIEVQENKYGKGVYAVTHISTGTHIAPWCNYVSEEELLSIPKDKRNIDHVTKIASHRYTLKSEKVDDYFNHSCDPNSGLCFDGENVFLVAIRDIVPNEEVVWDYSTTIDKRAIEMFPEWKMVCGCGAANCRKIVDSFDTLPEKVRAQYAKLGILPEFLRDGSIVQ